MRLGVVILPEHEWPRARELWQRADAMRFEHAWTYDHLTWRSFRDKPWFAAVPTLTAAAAVTSHLRLGLLIASPNFRHPLPFAKEMIAVDHVSDGRLIVGVGAGGRGWDATMLGQQEWSARERADRFAEFVEMTDLLLREPAVSYAGRYYHANEARTYPGCLQKPRPPLAIAASGHRGMALAAQFADIWVTTGPRNGADILDAREGATAVREQILRLEASCESIGRDPNSIRRLVLTGVLLDPGLASAAHFHDTVGLYEEAGVTDFVVHWPRADAPYDYDPDTFEYLFGR